MTGSVPGCMVPLTPAAMSSPSSIDEVFLYEVPSLIMYRFYEIMDSLDDTDWKKFASMIIFDQTDLRLLEQQGRPHSRTQNVIWSWTSRNARVGDLLLVLQKLKLLRAHNIFECWWLEYQSGLPATRNTTPTAAPTPPPRYTRPCLEQSDSEKKKQFLTPSQADTVLSIGSPLPLPGPPPPHMICSSVCPSQTSCSDSSSNNADSNIHSSVQESAIPSNLIEPPKHLLWNFQEVIKGTRNFSPSLLIGEGGFGCVYKATIRNTDYAVKRLKQDAELEWSTVKKSFHTEIEKLTCLRHPNIIDLAGYCMHGEEYCLIYLYLPNGSLEDRLHHQGSFPTLLWKQRLNILQGAACGVQFLHTCQPSIIHGDIKSSNILLDQALVPKIGDFGLARFSRYTCNAGKSRTLARTSTVRGTLAYLPDEYVKMGKLTFELDTYSFGVVLLEALTGRKAIDSDSNSHTKYLKDIVHEEESDEEAVSSSVQGATKVAENKMSRAASRICRYHLDSRIGHIPVDVAQELCLLACRCLGRQKKRPSMVEVFNDLKRLQELLPSPGMGHHLNVQWPASAMNDSFPLVLDLLSSLQDSILTPQENTDKFTPDGFLVDSPPALGSVRPYSPYVSRYEDKLGVFSSISSSGSLRTFQRTPNIPVESDESVPEFSRATASQQHSSGEVPGTTSPIAAMQCRSTVLSASNRSPTPETFAGQNNGSSAMQGGSSLAAADAQAISMPHHQIVMNPAKQRFVEQLALYEQGKISSLELLYSGTSPGHHSETRGSPEESDDFPS
ncbi:interleukin-1 receptor-associated kinase 1 isoform X2 [Pseudophryne corroboree]|uniref:interleukin-1 receptor-associated kinase 1 isoform X2 n=1 Tax=Pseudophryne corroboree TaxID=495146 RepID=UPI003081AEC0